MKYVSYLGETVLTTDGIGDAVVDYVRALLADRSADLIDIPVVVGETETTASLVIGPDAPLLVVHAEERETPLPDELPIARIRSRIAALGPHRVRPSAALTTDARALTFDYL